MKFCAIGYNGYRFGYLDNHSFGSYEDAKQYAFDNLLKAPNGDNDVPQGYIITSNNNIRDYIARMFILEYAETPYAPSADWILTVVKNIAIYEKI